MSPPGAVFGPILLDAWIRHRHPGNLAVHAVSGLIAWLGLTTVLTAIPTPLALPVLGNSAGAWLALLGPLAWLPLDAVVAIAVLLASLPVVLLGPPWPLGLAAFLVCLVVQHYAHVGWHEHASFLPNRRPFAALTTLFAPFLFGTFWLLDQIGRAHV